MGGSTATRKSARRLCRGAGSFDAPRHVLAHVGSRQHRQRQVEILRAPGQRPLHAHDDGGVGKRRHGELSALRNERLARPVTVHAAERRRHADGPADVRAHLERGEPGRQRGGAAPAAASRRAARVPGIAGAAVDRIVGLPVGQRGRDIGLAEQHRARRAEARRHRAVVRRDIALPLGHAAGGLETDDVDGFLQRDRQAAERRSLAPGGGLIGGARLLARPLEVADDDGVEPPVVPLDALDVEVGQLRRADPACA